MHAAVVHQFDLPPRYETFADPVPRDGEVLVQVRAAAASQLTRAVAAGKHYSSVAEFPFVPGFDGVGRLADGKRVYFAGVGKPYGAMAERVAVSARRTMPIPDEVDDVTAAALANPAMSSWAALTERARFVRGENVLVNGATGASGRLAIQIAKHLGARTVIATGRTAKTVDPLRALGADVTIALDKPPEELRAVFQHTLHAHAVDIVLDYLWGPPAEQLIHAIGGTGHGGAAPRIRFVQIGALAGAALPLPASILRSSGLELIGSGLGSLSLEQLVTTIGQLLAAARPAKLAVETESAPLSDVEAAWTRDTGGRRLVLTVS